MVYEFRVLIDLKWILVAGDPKVKGQLFYTFFGPPT